MDINKDISRRIPTNIISGFLGVGKTSAILNLLAQKPETERWAILVNEFGEIGIDGSLFQRHLFLQKARSTLDCASLLTVGSLKAQLEVDVFQFDSRTHLYFHKEFQLL